MITEVEVPRALWVLVLTILIAMQICSVARWPSGKASVSYLRGFGTFADGNRRSRVRIPSGPFFEIYFFFHKNCFFFFFCSSFQTNPHNF